MCIIETNQQVIRTEHHKFDDELAFLKPLFSAWHSRMPRNVRVMANIGSSNFKKRMIKLKKEY